MAEDEAAGRGANAARKRRKRGAEPANAAEAAMRALTEKKVSTKVNYSVLQNLFSPHVLQSTLGQKKPAETAAMAAAQEAAESATALGASAKQAESAAMAAANATMAAAAVDPQMRQSATMVRVPLARLAARPPCTAEFYLYVTPARI
eukprot:COSAG05_NODE_872_length_6839_cov_16.232938_8_plen_148_part_00